MQTFDSRLVRAEQLTPTVRRLWFERVEGGTLDFLPGQHARFVLPATDEAPAHAGAYSLCEPPRPDGRYAICVKQQRAHGVAEALLRTTPGTLLRTVAPLGRFVLEAAASGPLVLVATGVGVAPFHAMRDQLGARAERAEVYLLLGARRPGELLFDAQWRALADGAGSRFHYRPIVSRPQPEDAWQGAVGRVDVLLDALPPVLGEAHAYLCGHGPMVTQLRAALADRGLPAARLHTDH